MWMMKTLADLDDALEVLRAAPGWTFNAWTLTSWEGL
jgi:hypothetical protein